MSHIYLLNFYICLHCSQEKPNALLELFKPLLKFLTTIDFGQVTYEAQFLAMVAKAGFEPKQETMAASGLSKKVSEGRKFKLFTLTEKKQ